MAEDKPGFKVTTSDASETIIVNNDPPAQANAPAATKPVKGGTNADTP